MLQISSRIFSQIFFRRLFLEFKIRFGEPRRKKNADDKKKKFKFNAVQFNREKYFTSKPPSCPWKQPQWVEFELVSEKSSSALDFWTFYCAKFRFPLARIFGGKMVGDWTKEIFMDFLGFPRVLLEF